MEAQSNLLRRTISCKRYSLIFSTTLTKAYNTLILETITIILYRYPEHKMYHLAKALSSLVLLNPQAIKIFYAFAGGVFPLGYKSIGPYFLRSYDLIKVVLLCRSTNPFSLFACAHHINVLIPIRHRRREAVLRVAFANGGPVSGPASGHDLAHGPRTIVTFNKVTLLAITSNKLE